MSVGIRIALKAYASLRDVQTFAWNQNLNIVEVTREDETPTRFGWETCDETTSLDYLEDPILGVSYVTIRGERIAHLSEAVRTGLATWTFQDGMRLISAGNDSDAIIQGVYVGAISATRKDVPVVSEAFRSVIRHPDREVRRAVLVGIGYVTVGTELREIAKEIRNSDQDEGIRVDAGYLLEGLEMASAAPVADDDDAL
ncbi:hypothetical protein J2Z21_009805 [Streptomyces griseochromogenes]|uniref:Uncharacterized protein n=1 Tax=Streptomyces griseochromogenes TaxID=68214 RepID=A0ABS4MAS9_9ACTN|nr:hypothetical protein [Streptomyces griseochromogenes]MBP2056786.1 hypothetical protein [Streptomyces griseochromogenes]